MRAAVPWLFSAALLVVALPARAEDDLVFLSGGYLYSDVSGASPARAHGAELSVHWLPASLPFGFGAFTQAQHYGRDGSSTRIAAGAQITFALLGLELGYARRSAGEGPAVPQSGFLGDVTTRWSATSGVHVAPFVSFGFLYVAYRWTLPVSQGPEPSHGAEQALTVGLKVPIPVHGSFFGNVGRSLVPPAR